MTASEYLKCIKQINPDARVVVWEKDGQLVPKWDAAHTGAMPTLKECESVLPEVRLEAQATVATGMALAKLADIDIKSIRSIREWVAKQSDAPQYVKDFEIMASTERAKLK